MIIRSSGTCLSIHVAEHSELFPCSRRKDEAFGEAEKFIKVNLP